MGDGILGTGFYKLASSWTLWFVNGFIVVLLVAALIWALRKGYFKDVERPKYRMLEEDEQPEE